MYIIYIGLTRIGGRSYIAQSRAIVLQECG